MITIPKRNAIRQRVHSRIRAKMAGTAERPRLNVYRSLNHIYTQVIDDATGTTIASASTVAKKGEEVASEEEESSEAEGPAVAEESEEEAAFTFMPAARRRSITSLGVSPRSLAISCTRLFIRCPV